jgi:hypothetical protein
VPVHILSAARVARATGLPAGSKPDTLTPSHLVRSVTETAPQREPVADEVSRPRWQQILVPFVIAALAALYVVARGTSDPAVSDFDQLWHAARALMSGQNPYEYVGPAGVFVWDYLFYPLPAVLLVSPLALMPLLAARACLAAISAGLLSAVFLRDHSPRLLLLLSAPFLVAVGRGQFAPLLVATALIPTLSWLGLAKPNIAIPVLLASRNIRTAIIAGLIGGGILIALSFVVFPGWLSSWLDMLSRKNRSTSLPILGKGGFIIALALLRWRRPEAKLLFALGILPQTPGLYDTVPLFLIPRGFRENCTLAITGNLALLLLVAAPGLTTLEIGPLYADRVMLWASVCLYLPCVLMILRRPNAPQPVDRPRFRGDRLEVAMLLLLAFSTFFAGWATLGRYL